MGHHPHNPADNLELGEFRKRVLKDSPSYRLALSSIKSKTLPAKDDMEAYWIEPSNFLVWAFDKDLEMPEELRAAAEEFKAEKEKPKGNREDKPLKTREKRTLLIIIEALAKAARIDTSQPEKAGEVIALMTQEMGAPVDHQTIARKLKEIPDAVEAALSNSKTLIRVSVHLIRALAVHTLVSCCTCTHLSRVTYEGKHTCRTINARSAL